MVQSAKPQRRTSRTARPAASDPSAEAGVVSETTADAPTEERPPTARGRRGITIAAVVLVVIALLLQVRIAAQERSGPPRTDLSIGEGIPATLYLPDEPGDDEFLPEPPGERLPVVVVAHGYSADRLLMSSLARSLASAGYAALTFDFRGHGSNLAPFRGELNGDLDAVVDWVERSPLLDSSGIAVLGHSMGAGAAIDFATADKRVKAVVPISGGWQVNDANRPAVLFLVAEGDPRSIHDAQADLAEVLGDSASVTSREIRGANHGSILGADETFRQTVAFLDPILGVDRATDANVRRNDPRRGTVGIYFLVVLALIGFLGLPVGSLVPRREAASNPGGYVLVAGALLVTMPVLGAGGFGILPLGAQSAVVIHFMLAAAVLWATRLVVQRGVVAGPVARWIGDAPWLPLRQVLLPGLAAGLTIFVLLTPLAGTFHRLVPTIERFMWWVVLTALLLPFFAAFESLIRRGSTWAAIGWGVLGRVLLLVLLFVGVGAGVFSWVLALVTFLLVAQYVLLEIFAATAYGRGRNPALIAVVDAAFLGWIFVTISPVS